MDVVGTEQAALGYENVKEIVTSKDLNQAIEKEGIQGPLGGEMVVK